MAWIKAADWVSANAWPPRRSGPFVGEGGLRLACGVKADNPAGPDPNRAICSGWIRVAHAERGSADAVPALALDPATYALGTTANWDTYQPSVRHAVTKRLTRM